MVDNLIFKTLAWEDEKKMLFLYDGVGILFRVSLSLFIHAGARTFSGFISLIKLSFCSLQVRLVSILEDYKLTRQQREEEKRRYRVINL
jgi:protein regulator of cytokinesis 1